MSVVQAIPGFSLTNRWLLYTSVMLAPAQFISGVNNNCPSNIGFLAYNMYNQIVWYRAVESRQLHALCMLLPHFNLVYAFSYLGGVSSGTLWFSIPLGLGTTGVLILNTISAWKGWVTIQPEGFGKYQFFFFGWRTLNKGWHIFMLLWQINDSMFAFSFMIFAIALVVWIANIDDGSRLSRLRWFHTYLAIPLGAAAMLFMIWPLILWSELIVARNHIESATDWVAVWLFVAQVGTMLLPRCLTSLKCFGKHR